MGEKVLVTPGELSAMPASPRMVLIDTRDAGAVNIRGRWWLAVKP